MVKKMNVYITIFESSLLFVEAGIVAVLLQKHFFVGETILLLFKTGKLYVYIIYLKVLFSRIRTMTSFSPNYFISFPPAIAFVNNNAKCFRRPVVLIGISGSHSCKLTLLPEKNIRKLLILIQ
jgi:hypothetical protein